MADIYVKAGLGGKRSWVRWPGGTLPPKFKSLRALQGINKPYVTLNSLLYKKRMTFTLNYFYNKLCSWSKQHKIAIWHHL